MAARGTRSILSVVAVAVIAVLCGCTQYDVARLAGDATAGRQNGTPGSALAREFLIDELEPISTVSTQTTPGGTNILAVIRGTELPNEYVMVGAHYDHLGSACTYKSSGDTICNGATDNATGVAAVLAIGRAIAAQQVKPRRSVVLALWDEEEDGIVGSHWYVDHPVFPLEETVAYLNFDIQGANLLPSVRNTSFALGAETGGPRLEEIVRSAINASTLDMEMGINSFGQGRSDYRYFLGEVPIVFFTDATGPCYHTNDDEIGVVDFGKLDREIGIALRVTRELASTDAPPALGANSSNATYDDAVVIQRFLERVARNRDRFSPADQQTFDTARAELTRIVLDGRAAYDGNDVGKVLGETANVVNGVLPHGACDGFLSPTAQHQARALAALP